MHKQSVSVPVVSDAIERNDIPLSAAVKGGGFVFVSGLAPVVPGGGWIGGDIESQARACLDNLKAALEAAGSSLAQVVKVTIYATNAAHYRRINRVYANYFPEMPPARTFVTVGSWPGEFDLEIDCIALA